jgi:hypothetical protein
MTDMPYVLIKREDEAFVVGAEEREGLTHDVMLEVSFDMLVDGRKVSDWPEGTHEVSRLPSDTKESGGAT